jgi:hypothetical protein
MNNDRNDKISTFFAPIFSIFGRADMKKVSVSAIAMSALTPMSTGRPDVPFVISEHWFTKGTC